MILEYESSGLVWYIVIMIKQFRSTLFSIRIIPPNLALYSVKSLFEKHEITENIRNLEFFTIHIQASQTFQNVHFVLSYILL